MNQRDLNEKIESLRFVINDSHGAVSERELEVAVNKIKVRGNDLMLALDGKLSKTALKLTGEADALLDRSTNYIKNLYRRINTFKGCSDV